MEWIAHIAPIITAIGTLITVIATAITGFVMTKVNKKGKELENNAKETSLSSEYNAEWVKLYNEIKEENKLRDKEIEKLRDQLQLCSESKIDLINKNAVLESINIKQQVTHCDVVGCSNRSPQTGY